MEDRRKDPIDSLIKALLKERYVHSLSPLVYDRIATLWHLDEDLERDLAHLCSKVWIGHFCLRYLSHFNEILKRKVDVDRGLKAEELSEETRKDLRKKISDREMRRRLKEEIMPLLKDLMEKARARNLDQLTSMIHGGEYLLSSLEDMAGHEEYDLWLHSLPEMYRKDLSYSGILREGGRSTRPIYSYISNLEEFIPKKDSWTIQPIRKRFPQKRMRFRKGFHPCRTRVYTLTA